GGESFDEIADATDVGVADRRLFHDLSADQLDTVVLGQLARGGHAIVFINRNELPGSRHRGLDSAGIVHSARFYHVETRPGQADFLVRRWSGIGLALVWPGRSLLAPPLLTAALRLC